jgi:hypothetical protein
MSGLLERVYSADIPGGTQAVLHARVREPSETYAAMSLALVVSVWIIDVQT